jgi:hypothetical protein
MDREALTIVSTTASTLRVAAQWLSGEDRDMLLETAANTETDWDETCCPVCEEVTCDEGCPLESIRGGL